MRCTGLVNGRIDPGGMAVKKRTDFPCPGGQGLGQGIKFFMLVIENILKFHSFCQGIRRRLFKGLGFAA